MLKHSGEDDLPSRTGIFYDINCLLVPATNNGNESANGRFPGDFGTHPPFWNFCFTLKDELEKVSRDKLGLSRAKLSSSWDETLL